MGTRFPTVIPVSRDGHLASTTADSSQPGLECRHRVTAAVRLVDGRTVRGCARHCAEALLDDPSAVVLDLDDDTRACGDGGTATGAEPLSAAAAELAHRHIGGLGQR